MNVSYPNIYGYYYTMWPHVTCPTCNYYLCDKYAAFHKEKTRLQLETGTNDPDMSAFIEAYKLQLCCVPRIVSVVLHVELKHGVSLFGASTGVSAK